MALEALGKAMEVRDKLDELINEFGNYPVKLLDPLEGRWTNDIGEIRFDSEREQIVIAPED